jgi:hypothetical protein
MLLLWLSVLALATGVVAALLPARLRAWRMPAVLAGADVVMFVLIWMIHVV